ncbi:J domain-containing protein [Uliginosibacterium sp. H1]|uniref:J domain-containing protein n=1 Tax=Uliginosibacterium sp. H1 TaxID=3114757 RepID=UPI002E18D586|nr:J domain-containing protein [Uliginosibacterium sp. H1]
MNIWHTLDIAPTRDEREIRRAYARLLKTRQHEDDAAYFESLRQAYEQALQLSRAEDAAPLPGSSPQTTDAAEAGPGHHTAGSKDEAPRKQYAEPKGAEYEPSPEELAERSRFDALNAALRALNEQLAVEGHRSNEEHILAAWQALAQHELLERLDIREQVSDVIADMVARYWSASSPVWALAERYFAWEPPTTQDNSRLGHALRWLYDRQESAGARWQNLQDAYSQEDPHPETILARQQSSFKRYIRFAWSRAERVLMRRFVTDVDTLELADRFSSQAETLVWWRKSLSKPMLTKRYLLTLCLLCCPALFADSIGVFMLWIVMAASPIGLWYALELGWYRWRKDRGPLLDATHPVSGLGAPVLLAAGLPLCALAALWTSLPLLWAGTLLVGASAIWAWMLAAPDSHLKYLNDQRIFWFGFVFVVVSFGFGSQLATAKQFDTPARLVLQVVYGCSLASWLLLTAAPALRFYEARFPSLAEVPATLGVASASMLLLGLHLAMRDSSDAQIILGVADTIVVLLCWAFRQQQDWTSLDSDYSPYIAILIYVLTMVFITNGMTELGFGRTTVPPHGMAGLLGVALSMSLFHLWHRRRYA